MLVHTFLTILFIFDQARVQSYSLSFQASECGSIILNCVYGVKEDFSKTYRNASWSMIDSNGTMVSIPEPTERLNSEIIDGRTQNIHINNITKGTMREDYRGKRCPLKRLVHHYVCEAFLKDGNSSVKNDYRICVNSKKSECSKCDVSGTKQYQPRMDLSLVAGQNETLNCSGNCPRGWECSLTWYHNNKSLPTNYTKTNDCNCSRCPIHSTLPVAFRNKSDEGIYKCIYHDPEFPKTSEANPRSFYTIKTKPDELTKIVVPLVLIISSLLLAIVVIVVKGREFKMRWIQRSLRPDLAVNDSVYVFCCDSDAKTAEDVIGEPLRSSSLQVHVENGRDWTVGGAILDTLAGSVESADAIVLFLSNDYLDSLPNQKPESVSEDGTELEMSTMQKRSSRFVFPLIFERFLSSPLPVLFWMPAHLTLKTIQSSRAFNKFPYKKKLSESLNVWPIIKEIQDLKERLIVPTETIVMVQSGPVYMVN